MPINNLKDLASKLKSGEVKATPGLMRSISNLEDKIKSDKSKLDRKKEHKELLEAIKEIKIVVPEIKSPEVKVPEVVIPDINIPEIKVPKTEVEVKIPEIKVPKAEVEVKIPEIKIPDPKPVKVSLPKIPTPKVTVKKDVLKLPKTAKEAIPVRLVHDNEFYRAMGGSGSTIGSINTFANANNEKKSALVDDDGIVQMAITSPLESNGAVPVNIQDQTSELVDLYMCRILGTTNPTSEIELESKSIVVNSTTGATVGDCIEISENGRLFQALVLSVVDSTITFNAPTDQVFTTNAIVKFGEWNMNYDGSSTTLIYSIKPPEGVRWDITRIIISMTDDNAMDATTFGGITSLTNGIVLRIKNGVYKNIFVVSNNGGFGERAYDTSYDDRRSPLSEYGFLCRRTFAGQEKNGVTIRLNGDDGDELQFLIQDNLTALSKIAVVCQGHVVVD